MIRNGAVTPLALFAAFDSDFFPVSVGSSLNDAGRESCELSGLAPWEPFFEPPRWRETRRDRFKLVTYWTE